ncbi:MAG: hypothetical protein DI537_14040 [Stutzerimonas stutzeri]|nr:MAG: hypothetical protein DI537_14040 [Stutzerimonas stutzeri]
MDGHEINRCEFEEHLEVLNDLVIDAVANHFQRRSLNFDRVQFVMAATNEIDGLIRAALFEGAQVFPVEIPTKG